ncbi:MAG: glucose-methanol-choline oxidoreductase [Osedax symbiont Rs2]|nr:MAG: glucose-methanol-choline oxidoreductase [Osedax symbiont Rs2]
MKKFDYVVVGAGSAGCVVANRLSANPKVSVALLEAGGRAKSPWLKIPAAVAALYGNKKYDYTFVGVPQKHLYQRSMNINRGKMLGGSSAINSMVYIRGNQNDYDGWQALGCAGWSYQDVLPIYKKMEANQIGQDAAYHGFSGELSVAKPQDPNRVSQVFVTAGAAVGLPENCDFNADSQFGLGVYNVKQNKGVRVSGYSAFVEPILSRPNLTVLTHCEVLALQIDNDRVTGLEVELEGVAQLMTCQREVILCAGTIISPRILLASGIGDRSELERLGIECKQHLPGVGENLQDHVDSMVTVRSCVADTIGVSLRTLLPDVLTAPFNYMLARKGWWTTNYVEAGGFAKTKLAEASEPGCADADPDIQFHFTPMYRSHRGKTFEFGHGYSLFTCVLRPRSVGTVKLANDGSRRNVLIDHNFFSDKRDQLVLIDGVKKAREILASPAFDHIRGEEMAPGNKVQTDAEILEYLRHTTSTVYHPVGTCKMGTDSLAVVSPDSLKVKGMRNLRVIDASIMPTLISGNTSAPAMMIAEKGSLMILQEHIG